MAIADYTDLLGLVAEYTGRDDFAHMFPRFVSFAESKMERQLRVGGMETATTITTVAAGTVALPNNYMEMREVKDSTGRILDLTTLPASHWQHGPYSGTPETYGISGTTFNAIPKAIGTFSIIYFARIPALTPSSSTNWLLTDAPLLYLYSVCVEVIGWSLATGKEAEPAKLQLANSALKGELDSYRSLDTSKRYSNAKIYVRGVTP